MLHNSVQKSHNHGNQMQLVHNKGFFATQMKITWGKKKTTTDGSTPLIYLFSSTHPKVVFKPLFPTTSAFQTRRICSYALHKEM